MAQGRRALDSFSTVPGSGTLLREENGAIWVTFGGARVHVPDMPTFNRLFPGWPAFPVWNGALDGLSTMPRDGTLLREESSSTVFVITGGMRWPAGMHDANSVRVVWDGALSYIPWPIPRRR